METELKLIVRPEHRARLLGHPALRAAQVTLPKQRHGITTYFDTPDLALEQAGLSLRIRQNGGQQIQTVKAKGSGDGVALRRGNGSGRSSKMSPTFTTLAKTLGKTGLARLRVPAEALTRWSHEHRGRARHRSAEGWREFKKATPFWAARGDALN